MCMEKRGVYVLMVDENVTEACPVCVYENLTYVSWVVRSNVITIYFAILKM